MLTKNKSMAPRRRRRGRTRRSHSGYVGLSSSDAVTIARSYNTLRLSNMLHKPVLKRHWSTESGYHSQILCYADLDAAAFASQSRSEIARGRER